VRGAPPCRDRPAARRGPGDAPGLGASRVRSRAVLGEAIEAGGKTLRDFLNAEGEVGYFAFALRVYDRAGEPCRRCGATIRRIVQAGRSTFYCPRCQK
jgi:formamidopyrimidine-DNA glycosylase